MRYQNFLLLLSLFLASVAAAQSPGATPYDIGSPTLTDLYVDPVSGSDDNNGLSRANAFRTLTEAWTTIPTGTLSTTGYRINLMPGGSIAEADAPNYWDERRGTANFPIIIQAADGAGTATLNGDINIAGVSYFYLLDFNIVPLPAGDVFHCEQCDHVLLRNMVLSGSGEGTRAAHETVKVNQSQYIYIEGSNIYGSYENAIDYVSVQYGHIIDSKIHDADDWCAYTKGGSAYLLIEGNEFYNCGTGGFTVGQGTGFEYMTSPWLHYEGYDIKVVNNVIHDTEGAGLGVNGGYNILLAFNTLYRVGSRSHLIEVVYGSRSCDGTASACAANRSAGGWGPSGVTTEGEPIPNKNIFITNNVIYNPSGYQSGSQHFAVYGPQTPSGSSGIPSPARSDVNLRIAGNVIWNGSGDMPLGVGDDQGCLDSNPTCNAAQLVADNTINSTEPDLLDPANGDFRPGASGALATLGSIALTSFSGGDRESTPQAAEGNLTNSVTTDLGGTARSLTTARGAFANSSSTIGPDTRDDVTPSLTVNITRARATRIGRQVRVKVRATVGGSGITTVLATARHPRTEASLGSVSLTLTNGTYRGRVTASPVPGRVRRLSILVTATNGDGEVSDSQSAQIP